MTKRRDAGTGQYISREEAAKKDKNTWVTEQDIKQKREEYIQLILKAIYEHLLAHAGYAECEDFESVKVENITKVFKEAGLKIDG